MLEAIVGVGGLLIAAAQLFLQLGERRSDSGPEFPRATRLDDQPAWETGREDLPWRPSDQDSIGARESPREWVERKQRDWERERASWERGFQQERARMASSLAMLAATVLGIGSAAYVAATAADTPTNEFPAAFAWGATALGGVAAALSGLAWLVWRQSGPHSRGAPLALLVLLAGGVLAVFALRLLSGSGS